MDDLHIDKKLWKEAVQQVVPPSLLGWLYTAEVTEGPPGCLRVAVDPAGLPFVESHLPVDKLAGALGKQLGRPVTVALAAGTPATAPAPQTPRASLQPKTAAPAAVYGHGAKGKARPVSTLEVGEGPAAVEGMLCRVQQVQKQDGGQVIVLDLTDQKDGLRVKVFPKGPEGERIAELRPGDWLSVKGEQMYDRFERDHVLLARQISRLPIERRRGARPRAELHLHTRMSTMDGLIDPHRLVAEAGRLGIDGLVVTDHGSIQAFPDLFAAAKRAGLKAGFGVEAYMVDDLAPPVTDATPAPLFGDFVALDFETSSLSPLSGEIIEIGAVRFSGAGARERLSTLVRPRGPVSPETYALTGISPRALETAPDIDGVIDDLRSFLGDWPLVAHNAPFDAGFLRALLASRGLALHQPVIDTLALSRAFLPELSAHRLQDVAGALGISMGAHHRAADDAATCGAIFVRLREKIGAEGVETLEQLASLPPVGADRARPVHAQILLARQVGLEAFYELISKAHVEQFHRSPRVRKSQIKASPGLLFGASGCGHGELVQAIVQGESAERLRALAGSYDYIEVLPPDLLGRQLAPMGLAGEGVKEIVRGLEALGAACDLPVVAVSDAHFIEPEDERIRSFLIRANKAERVQAGPAYLRTSEEMLEAFAGTLEAPERAIFEAPKVVLGLLEDILPVPEDLHPPDIPEASGFVESTARRRLKELYGASPPVEIAQRLEKEMKAILDHDYSAVYYLAARLVQKSLSDGYLVGSRGSVGSSLVAYLLGITEVNPLAPHYRCAGCGQCEFVGGVASGFDLQDRSCPCGGVQRGDGHDIPFETFLGFEGEKVPDIDLNFSGTYQPVIHSYVEELMGASQVFRAGTISTVAERTAFGMVKGTLEEEGVQLRKVEVERLAAALVGVKRTTGQHPGGVMIIPKGESVFRFTPLQHPADDASGGAVTTHFDYHAISARLLKLDLLGHDDPTVLRHLEALTGVSPADIPWNDPDTLSLFSSVDALGVSPEQIGTSVGSLGLPEFGTRFVRGMLESTRPSSFGELVRISGLSHGTDVWVNNAKDLIEQQAAGLKDVIATRDDIMLTLIEMGVHPPQAFAISEKVRKGKLLSDKERALLRHHRVPEWYIASCEKISYLFPKAHAAAYVMMAVRIAYFKVHHPAAFYAAYFSVREGELDVATAALEPPALAHKIKGLEQMRFRLTAKERSQLTLLEILREMHARNITMAPFDVQRSAALTFSVVGPTTLLPPFVSIPGLGRSGAIAVEKARQEAPFASVADLRARGRLPRPALELLREMGALSGLSETNQMTLF